MAAITYVANARAPLITDSPAHEANESYEFDVKLRAFSKAIDQPKTQHVSLGGQVETVLKRATDIYGVTIIWPDDEDAQVEEFLYSVAGGEQFTIDPYGTVASADSPFGVIMTNSNVSIGRLQHGKVHWRSASFNVRKAYV